MSYRSSFPLIAFGTPEDLTGWSISGTPVVTGSQDDPVGGTDASLVNDDDGGAVEYIYKIVPITIDGTHFSIVAAKEGTSTVTDIEIYDSTAPASRVIARITWSTHALSILSGNGTALGLIAIGDGYYLAIFTVESVVGANTNVIRLYPAGSTASAIGTAYFYVRHFLIFGEPLDNANSFGIPQPGSQFARTPGGVEDAWISGTDQHLRGQVRWIPSDVQSNPRVSSPWNGDGEVAGVPVGWDHFLNVFARDKQTFLWIPNRTLSDSVNISSYLVEPMKSPPALEVDFTRSLALWIRSSTGSKYRGY